MKKIVFISMAVLLGSSTLAGIVINGIFTVGRKSQNCNGLGVCSATLTTKGYTESSVNGTLDVDQAGGSMILSLNGNDLQNLQPEKLVFFSNRTELTFDEDFIFPVEFNTAVQASKPLIIKKGTYSLSYKNGKYCIEIPL